MLSTGFEPMTPTASRWRSTNWAKKAFLSENLNDGIRTRDSLNHNQVCNQ